MNTIKNVLEKCRTYVAVQKFGCGMTSIGHGVEDNILQFLNEADEELARLEKREPTLMSDCISAGLPLDVALKYDVQLCRLTNYVRDKTLADCVKQEPVATDLMDMLRLIETIKYLRGIAERGLGREIRDDETIEQFVLGYVKQLEAAPARTKDLTPYEITALIRDGAAGGGWQGFAQRVIAADREKNK